MERPRENLIWPLHKKGAGWPYVLKLLKGNCRQSHVVFEVQTVWPRFGIFLSFWQNCKSALQFLTLYLVFAKILNLLCKVFYDVIGQIFFVLNRKILKNNNIATCSWCYKTLFGGNLDFSKIKKWKKVCSDVWNGLKCENNEC